jgi:hypothetical protein
MVAVLIREARPNNLAESNRRPAPKLGAEQQFQRLVHAQAPAFVGGRSANRCVKSR